MEQPDGFSVLGQDKKVCRFFKSFYGLKQWHQKLDNVILEKGFEINEYEKCTYEDTN